MRASKPDQPEDDPGAPAAPGLEAASAADLRAEIARLQAALRQRDAAIRHVATHDRLTGLLNRQGLLKVLSERLKAARSDAGVAVLFLDFDRFKVVNDTLGHDVGDALLNRISARLRAALRPCAALRPLTARVGGDEFVVLLDSAADLAAPLAIAERLQAVTRESHRIGNHEVVSPASIGVCVAMPGESADTVLRHADAAMYDAKARGRGRCVLFDTPMRDAANRRTILERDLRAAACDGHFSLLFQPVVCLESSSLVGVEALLRWDHPRLGPVAPLEAVPIAEELGLCADVDAWAVRAAAERLFRWRSQGLGARPLWLAVNVSPRTLAQPGAPERLLRAALAGGARPGDIRLEVRESCLHERGRPCERPLRRLAELGFALTIDNFGAATASLNAIGGLPVSAIKVDGSVVAHAGQRGHAAILRAIANLAHDLGLSAIACGVESGDHLPMLQALEFDCAQGFHLCQLLDGDELADLLAAPVWRSAA